MANTMFKVVNDPAFKGWNKVQEISENELFGTANNSAAGTVDAPANPSVSTGLAPTDGTAIGQFLDETMGVEMIDTLVATAGVIGLSFAGITSTKAALSATPKEKEGLKPVIRAVLDSVKVRISNPWEALFWAVVVCYGSKAAIVVVNDMNSPKKPKEKRESNPIVNKLQNELKRRHTGKPDCKCPKCVDNE